MPASKVIDGVLYGSPTYGADEPNKNIGGLIIADIDGVRGLIDAPRAKYLIHEKISFIDIDEVGDFMHEHSIRIIPDNSISEIYMWALKREDIRELARKLSELLGSASVSHSARVLARFKDGVMTFGPAKLSDYYTNITASQEADAAF